MPFLAVPLLPGRSFAFALQSQQNSSLAAVTEQILCYPRIAFAELFYATPCHRFDSPCPAIAEPRTANPCPCLTLPGLAVAILTIQCRSYPVLCSAPAPSCFAVASSRSTLPLPFLAPLCHCSSTRSKSVADPAETLPLPRPAVPSLFDSEQSHCLDLLLYAIPLLNPSKRFHRLSVRCFSLASSSYTSRCHRIS